MQPRKILFLTGNNRCCDASTTKHSGCPVLRVLAPCEGRESEMPTASGSAFDLASMYKKVQIPTQQYVQMFLQERLYIHLQHDYWSLADRPR